VPYCHHRYVCLCHTKPYAALLDDGVIATSACFFLPFSTLAEYSDGTLQPKRELQQLYAAGVDEQTI